MFKNFRRNTTIYRDIHGGGDIAGMDLMKRYDKDKEKSRSDWLRSVVGRFRKKIEVKYAYDNGYEEYAIYTVRCRHLEPHERSCDVWDEMVNMQIDRMRGK